MIIDDKVIIVSIRNSFDIIMYSIVIHFGMNPRNGGIPPILNIIIMNDNFSDMNGDLILN